MAIEGRSYTHARRHSLVAGKLGGATWPIAVLTWGESSVSGAQLATIAVAFIAELYTQAVWAHFGMTINLTLGFAVPTGLGRLMRAVKIEGRSPFAAVAGFAMMALSPRKGMFHGRPRHAGRSSTIRRSRVWTQA